MFRKSPASGLLLSIIAYFALWLLVPRATFLPHIVNTIDTGVLFIKGPAAFILNLGAVVIVAAPTVAFMAIQIALVYFFAKLKLNFWQGLLALVACLGLIAAMLGIVIIHAKLPAKLHHYPNLKEHLFIMANYYGPLAMPMNVLKVLAAASIGCLVAVRVKDKNLLLPVVMIAACIDFWTVFFGPVATMLKHAPSIAPAVSAPIPQVGTGTFMPVTMVGPGDFLFMALVFAAVHQHKMNGARNYVYVFCAMTIGMLAVMFGLLSSLPALIVLAIAVVSANRREFNLTRQEKISMLVVGIVLLCLMTAAWSVLKARVEKNVGHTGRTLQQRHSESPAQT
ncbi:MAG: hypothetical protein M1133_10980 [Armatimonadetes bacterium]|nr:hypothetical protein [Armatimonadota bacterium]